ncbi:MAG: uroporphyrinogen-III synthase [Propionibacteriaceae bacterium]|nr:uroporphyrinogen-III synthase [Propionibacteriaceae bacterium]
MAGALTGQAVLIARDPDRAEGLRARLKALGADVRVCPVTATLPGDPGDLDATVASLNDFDWVVVASVNAVNALHGAAQRMSTRLAAAATNWAAIGPATASALQAIGVHVALVAKDHSAVGLVADLTNTAAPGQRALLPQGDLAAPTLADGLKAAGFQVTAMTAYRTVSSILDAGVVQDWNAGKIDVSVIAAPSAAEQIAAQLDVGAPVAIVAIGHSTAKAARAAGFQSVVVADDSTDEALAAAVCKAAADKVMQ